MGHQHSDILSVSVSMGRHALSARAARKPSVSGLRIILELARAGSVAQTSKEWKRERGWEALALLLGRELEWHQ